MKSIFYLLPLALVLLVACHNSSDEETGHKDHESTKMNIEETDGIHLVEVEQNNVLLDNGKKWKANPETITGIEKMQSLVQNAIAGKASLTTLNDSLQFEFKTIFEKCTMTGASHTQLHNYLLPLKVQLTKIKEGNINTESLKEIQDYLLTFKNYFEGTLKD